LPWPYGYGIWLGVFVSWVQTLEPPFSLRVIIRDTKITQDTLLSIVQIYEKCGVAMAERSLAPDWELRSKVVVVGSIPGRPCQQCKKINKALSVRVIVSCSGHKLLWQNSFKGVGCASTSPESILHKIIIIIMMMKV